MKLTDRIGNNITEGLINFIWWDFFKVYSVNDNISMNLSLSNLKYPLYGFLFTPR